MIMTKEQFNSKYKVKCTCGEYMQVDDIDVYKLESPIVYLLCSRCNCSCRVQSGKIIDYTDENEETHKC